MSSLHSLAEFLASLIAWFDSKEKGTAVERNGFAVGGGGIA